ncbi:DEAD/DEAH box helicase [[Mycoplasma] testudinis]|uniref:DEAD/DEAH box helicase n=1 Tax=[Mycoplasma] testudinis TaxID=33924 RepID=UPI000563F741|nr:DEAD/DEAH box helicase [[Mycoplasma] testudinis]
MEWKKYIQEGLDDLKIKKLTKIQEQVIPNLLKKQNIIGVSQTGTGKTLAYLLPILENLDFKNPYPQAVIISPTRELASQIKNVIIRFMKYEKRLVCRLLVGGSDYNKQLKQLTFSQGQIIVATPQRIIDTFKTGFNWNFDTLKYLVYDEADMLIDTGFWNSLEKIQQRLTKSNPVQAAFSATLHQAITDQIQKVIKNAKIIDVTDSIWVHTKIKHYLITNKSMDKFSSLGAIVKQINPYLCLIFVNDSKHIKEIEAWFHTQNITPLVLHGKLSPTARKQAFKAVHNSQQKYLITTDLGSRGLDIEGVSHVISWNLPNDDIWYVHRSGRTSRANYEGESYVLYDPKDDFQLQRLERKGIIWIPLKVNRDETFSKFQIVFKKPKKPTLDPKMQNQINFLRATKDSRVQPNHQKKLKLKIKKIKQKAKHAAIERQIKQNLLKKYKKNSSRLSFEKKQNSQN